jgi:3-hydroxyacyl-[acyl-carrier-protein] dehydratase
MRGDLTLPRPAEAFLPHRKPMRLVETLVSFNGEAGQVEACLGADSLFAGADGFLDEAVLIELLAQSYAVIKGYEDLLQGKEISEGYLVGVKKLRVSGRAPAGTKLQVTIRTVGSFEKFAIAEGQVACGGVILASGTVKLWVAGGTA